MSYTGRKKYKSRQEKAKDIQKKTKVTFWVILIFLSAWAFYRRVDIYDYLYTYFR